MKSPTLLVLLTLASLASSCSKRPSSGVAVAATAKEPPAAGYCLPASTAWQEEQYTQWMTSAELQFYQEQAPAGQYFAHVEGRNNAGLCEYRAVRPQALPVEQYVEAGVFWGQNDKRLFDTELRLLRAGFVRKSMQVFIDASGCALHQFVWLRPVGTPPVAKPATPPLPADPNPPELSSTQDATAPEPAAALVAATDPEPTPADKPPATASVVAPSEARPAPAAAAARESQKFTTYTVVQGDILERIARRHHTTAEAILAASELKSDSIHIGQKLKLPKK
ncbi:MAG: LysM peptidoglycan-binding domain-containing protein [Verrucomicrobia bacterium]|nr:MAG: LysM peptidoglycan-binding domain-containing protein [Verrucomicrobiota bacterium]